MVERVTLSGAHQSLSDIARHHEDVESALRAYFSISSARLNIRFDGYSGEQLRQELSLRLAETDYSASLTVLAALEASFRIDYLQRCHERKRDAVSRAMRHIYAVKKRQASLDDEIFQAWADNRPGAKVLVSELRGAFKFRHWLAHGRYWTPKLGRQYDFNDVYTLAEMAARHFGLVT